jgi:hypothetical protein
MARTVADVIQPPAVPAPLTMADARVVELRHYTLHPGTFDTLVTLFEREFIEPQEAAGMAVGGLFRDRDRPDRFVWYRGFAGMDGRRAALEAFYGGPVWAAHRDAANATMVDSDDVLLLRPTDPPHPHPAPTGPRPPVGATGPGTECVAVTTYVHRPDPALTSWLTRDVHPLLEDVLGTRVVTWRTEPSPNDFPRLPVRDDNAFVWLATFPDEAAHSRARHALDTDPRWRDQVFPRLAAHLRDHRQLRLQPTPRSRHLTRH